MLEYTIAPEQKNKRLDKFLVEKLPEHSRAQIQKLIKRGGVLINNKKVSVHHFLKEGDQITILDTLRANPLQGALPSKSIHSSNRVAEAFRRPRTESPNGVPERSRGGAAEGAELRGMPRLEIVADTPAYLILNKPAGLLVHEAPGDKAPTLVDWLLEKYPGLSKIGEDPLRPAIVHRLDKEVSGLMVVPKTQDMFDHLKKQFKTRQIKKEYTALVYGAPKKMEDKISFNIDRSETAGHKMAAIPTHQDRGRKAVTEFEVIEQLGNYALLKVKPQTGRTHQIRVHLNAYGLPIVGDLTYRPKKLKIKLNLGRIFLHADYLGFFDLENKWEEYKVPLPDQLEKILKDLKQ